MNLTDFSIKSPFAIIALGLLILALGIFSFFRTPSDLFPDTVPPQVVTVTVWPGADSDDISDKITRILEKEIDTLDGLNKIASVSRDEVSSINAEFHYGKPLGEALLDVQNAIDRVRAYLPENILEPRLYKISDATRPLMTIALAPKKGSGKDLAQIRLLAENQIQDALLNVEGVADVDIFGAHKPEVKVRVDRLRLIANGLKLDNVIAALASNNISTPAGIIYSPKQEQLIKVSSEYENLDDIRQTPVVYRNSGILRLGDIADISLEETEQRSVYHGNGKRAIALNILRSEDGGTIKAIKNVKAFLPRLKRQHPDIEFYITDDQQPIIDLNINGMRSSLLQAILLTVAVIFLFLADMRAAFIVSVSIPLAFMSSLIVLWFSPYTLNMVTLSGLIISVGMVVDASIVVLENIYRHYNNKGEDETVAQMVGIGAKEVMMANTAGLLTTVVVLVPVMFSGGYSQQTMRPLNMMIVSTLIASLLAALAVIPLMASRLLSNLKRERNFLERVFKITDRAVATLGKGYLRLLRNALRLRWLVILLAVGFMAFTMKNVKPLIGGELMPPMDTGIVNLTFETPSDFTPKQVEEILFEIEEKLYLEPSVTSISSVVGSEPGEVSFGGGGATAQSGKIKIILLDRTKRNKTIWEIQDSWRKELETVKEIRSFTLSEYGATPVSTTKAPLNIIISGPDPLILDRLATRALTALEGSPGLVDVRRSWFMDKSDYRVRVDPDLAVFYNISQADIARELRIAVKGVTATRMRLKEYLDIPVTVQYQGKSVEYPDQLRDIYVNTHRGQVPLRAMADIRSNRAQPFITRERLLPTIDITGVNRGYTIAHVTGMVKEKLSKIKVPGGYRIKLSGSAVDMKLGQREMGRALIIGIALLFILLVGMFKSFLHPFTIMAAIPLAAAGGFWGLLIFDKPMCKPAMMGMILLGGTIVNNSILLLDFIIKARKEGMERDKAIARSVKLRLRPIMMTTVSTVIGLTPLIFEMAVGLERMSPLGIVAASGLLLGTFLTMIVVPVVYSLMDDLSRKSKIFLLWFFKGKVHM